MSCRWGGRASSTAHDAQHDGASQQSTADSTTTPGGKASPVRLVTKSQPDRATSTCRPKLLAAAPRHPQQAGVPSPREHNRTAPLRPDTLHNKQPLASPVQQTQPHNSLQLCMGAHTRSWLAGWLCDAWSVDEIHPAVGHDPLEQLLAFLPTSALQCVAGAGQAE